MKKKLLFMLAVLAMASVANATILISVDGVVDPPDTEIELYPSDWVTIDLWGDGTTPGGMFLLTLDCQGPGSFDISGAVVLYAGSKNVAPTWLDDAGLAGSLGAQNPMVYFELTDPVVPPAEPEPLEGTLIDDILFHCDAEGEVIITVYDGALTVLDTQIIHQVPEPMTIALLGLGGLFLRRRK